MRAGFLFYMSRRWIQLLLCLTLLAGFASLPTSGRVLALDQPTGPDRYAVITVDYTEYTWLLVTWSRNAVVCKLFTDYEGPPSLLDIFNQCGQTIYNKWLKQPPCFEVDKSKCVGYYTQMVNTTAKQKQIPTKLPASSAWLSLEGCKHVPSSSTNICENAPRLVITGEEPLPDEQIVGIAGTVDGQSFECEGSACVIEIISTPEEGATINFWVYSTYGDSSDVFSAQVRVAQADEGDPDQQYWYIDVLSDHWRGDPVATCSDLWESFPPVGGPPEWLTTPRMTEDLSSDIPYIYLAGNLIRQGAVDAKDCPDGGLDPSGAANTCGLEKARPAVTEWQNRFDVLILSTAQETGVPAHLLKNLFARESQFWPGAVNNKDDVGLGQLTQNGADTTLIWNESFYGQFCPLVLSSKECGKGYLHLSDKNQLLLRHALINSVDARCEECPLGLDLSRAEYSVGVFANTLLANCEQTGQLVRNVTDSPPGSVASYEDLWKYTLVNYNAGPGCLGDALQSTSDQNLDFVWDNVIAFLPPACTGAIDYVNDISK
jgi:hypothetical protein